MDDRTFKIISIGEEPSYVYGTLFPDTVVKAVCVQNGREVTSTLSCGLGISKCVVKRELLDAYKRDLELDSRPPVIPIVEGDIL